MLFYSFLFLKFPFSDLIPTTSDSPLVAYAPWTSPSRIQRFPFINILEFASFQDVKIDLKNVLVNWCFDVFKIEGLHACSKT